MSERRRPSSLRELLAKHDTRPGTINDAVLCAEKQLIAAKVDSPRLSAELLAAKAFGLSRLGLIMRAKDKPDDANLTAFRELVSRREKGEPAAYILGEKEFFGLTFRVTPDVLIPRPETELIVEEVQRLFPANASFAFADFGTGSGALAVALAHEFPAARGLAVDVCGHALEVARQNARANGVEERLAFQCADFTRLDFPVASLDLLVSNPPYVTESEYAELSPEVRFFEPRLALVSPEQGLWHLEALLPVARLALRPGGVLLCEIGSGQGAAAQELTRQSAYEFAHVSILKDYAGLDRILKVVLPSQKCGECA
ncbi:MAG: peptide chain release factor N(5)-glutamine methyltransferase [Humidesulfovibrio sp.]|uniref:peptide chain release factor N(5)-glutamine methyltransferase n=1 Tax=Humidesulfovibrio sp. TaxID=2910988 RepID=UPI002733F79F|nr:peptide chain release factor N(5)-glutamine methyltransferase [Humidesulfovibrio sp.]MDP2848109.1 peptide chain release factor N(5)-glutamine methyltransferase [Humidesulfovibrio sp.]